MTARRDRNTVVTKVETDQGRLLKQEIPEQSTVSGTDSTVKSNIFYGLVTKYEPTSKSATLNSSGTTVTATNYSGFTLVLNDAVVYTKLNNSTYLIVGVRR